MKVGVAKVASGEKIPKAVKLIVSILDLLALNFSMD